MPPRGGHRSRPGAARVHRQAGRRPAGHRPRHRARDPRAQFHTIWTKLTAFAKDHPKAFAFLELHHHASYLDEQSKAIENQLLEFATGFISHAQNDGVLKPGKPMLLMSLVYGAFTGIVRASWEGRLDLTDEDLERAEQICWQAISQ